MILWKASLSNKESAMTSRRNFLAMTGLGASSLLWPQLGCQPAGKKLNFIFILVDDMGWTDARCCGSDLYDTPHIDQLAAEGVRFTNGYAACTVCSPTRASLMTGKYPARLHVTDWIEGHKRPFAKLRVPDWTMRLEHNEVTLAEALKAGGYATAHIGKWHLGKTDHYPDTQGFDVNIGGTHRGQPPSYFFPYEGEGPWAVSLTNLTAGKEGEYLTDREAEETCRFIEAHQNEPFYINLAHYAVHTPIQGKPELAEKYKSLITEDLRHQNETYAAMIQSVDESLGTIRKKLEELNLLDNTVIFFTGDNGGLTDRPWLKKPVTDNSPLRAGKGSAYEGGVRVPAIIRHPHYLKGCISEEPVITCDYYPTILDMAGVRGDAAHNAGADGVSLLPLLGQPASNLSREALYWHYPHYHPGGATPHSAVRKGDFKLIEFFEDDHLELYNLREDIGETRDLSEKLPDQAAALHQMLKEWRQSVGAQLPLPNPDYDPERIHESG
jgi:arylsulfatase A